MEDKINRLSNIKAIGLATLIIFGLVGFYLLIQLIASLIIEFPALDNSISHAERQIELIFLVLVALCILISIGGYGLSKLKKWGLYIFHFYSIILILGLIFYAIYSVLNIDLSQSMNIDLNDEFENNFNELKIFVTTAYGIFLVLVAWILVRANLLLFRKSYNSEFG